MHHVSRYRHVMIYLGFVSITLALYAWYVRGVTVSRLFPFGAPAPIGDSVHGQWSQRAAMSSARTASGAAALNGLLYVVGGMDAFGRTLDAMETYDPKTDRWARAPSLPERIMSPSVVALDGYLYVIGGFTGLFEAPTHDGWVFDPVTGTWQTMAPMPEARGAMGALAIDGKIAVLGGRSHDGVSRALFFYDPAMNTWSINAPMPTPRSGLVLLASDRILYAIGGFATENGRALATVEQYDLTHDQWGAAPSLPHPRADLAGTTRNGTLIVAGGTTGSRVHGETYGFAAASLRWETFTPMPTPRHGFGLVNIEGVLFAAGGGSHVGISVSDVLDALAFGS